MNCVKAKLLLSGESKIIVECDELLKFDRQTFIDNMEKKMNCKFKSFPMIFIDDIYLGEYQDLVDHLNFDLLTEF
jgi:glutaredoxin